MPDLQSQILAAMGQLIAVREMTFIDAGVVTRPASQSQTPVLDADGNVVQAADVTVYTGPGVISDPRSALQANRTVTDESGAPNQRILKLPIDSPELLPGDVWTHTASAVSPGLVGERFVIAGEEERSYATSRRYLLRGSSWESAPTGG